MVPFGGESSHPRAVFAFKSKVVEFEVATSDDLVAPSDIQVSSTMVEKDMGDAGFDHEMNRVSSMVVKKGKGVSSLKHQMRPVGSMVVEKDTGDGGLKH